MKGFILLVMSVLLLFATAGAQTKLVDTKPYGSKGQYTITPTNDSITIVPKYSASAYVCPVDTNLYFFADTTAALPLNILYLELKADATKRYIYFKTGFAGVSAKDSLTNKSVIYTFVYSKAGKFTLLGKSAEY